jgi:hypothetical protein
MRCRLGAVQTTGPAIALAAKCNVPIIKTILDCDNKTDLFTMLFSYLTRKRVRLPRPLRCLVTASAADSESLIRVQKTTLRAGSARRRTLALLE